MVSPIFKMKIHLLEKFLHHEKQILNKVKVFLRIAPDKLFEMKIHNTATSSEHDFTEN